MNVYLWDAGKFCGVATCDRSAVAAAEACMTAGAASNVRVELARVSLSSSPRLEPSYERSGTGWTARLDDDGQIAWTDLSDLVTLDGEAVWCTT